MWFVKTYRATLIEEANSPIAVGQGRKRFNKGLEDDTVQERENKGNPGHPVGVDLRGRALYYMSSGFAGIEQLGQDKPWD